MTRHTYLQVLHQGRTRRKPVANTAFCDDITTLNDAYDFADDLVALRLAEGQVVTGYKIGATTPTAMAGFGVSEPFFAKLTGPKEDVDTTQNAPSSPSDPVTQIPLEALNQPLIEPELVFIALDTLYPTDDLDTLATKLLVSAGLEIPDTRYANWRGNLSTLQFICDNAGAFGVIYEDRDLRPCTYDSLDNIHGELYHNGQSLGHATSQVVYTHPLKAVQWLVQTLHTRGDQVTRGQIISSGSFIAPQPLALGTYEARYEGVGSITLEVV